jgi:fatty-acyl-CoA synthase
VHIIDAIPLTGVGKVFKPQLRWEATQRVFIEAVQALAEQGITCQVSVGADGTHGTFASVSVQTTSAISKDEAARRISACLNPFTIRHQISWT